MNSESNNPLKQGPTELEIMQAVKNAPGISTKQLREQLILGQRGKNGLALCSNRNSLMDKGLLKMGKNYDHHLTGEGEIWIKTHAQAASNETIPV